MKQLFGRVSFGLLLLAALSLVAKPSLAVVEPLDQIVAIVDEDVVVRSELDQETAKILARIKDQDINLPPKEVLERQILESLIMRKLQLAAAQRMGIAVSEDILAQTIGDIARSNELTISEFRQTMEEEGISFRTVRNEIRDQLIIRQLLEREVLQQVRVTDQEIKAYQMREGASLGGRTEYRLQHILVSVPEGASSEELENAEKEAQRLVSQLRSGADFSSVALSESDGQQALNGGDLGWRPANQLPTIFTDSVATMERGEISDPIRSPSGYHIIKVVDFQGGERHLINQTEVRHILIATNEITSNQEAKTRLSQLRQRIIGGDDFGSLARSNSDDQASAVKGGELGWVTPGDLLPKFEKEMDQLEIGQISGPFQTEFGWHIVQVLDRREQDSTEEYNKAEIRAAIRERKFEEASELYLRRLKDEAYIDIKLDPV